MEAALSQRNMLISCHLLLLYITWMQFFTCCKMTAAICLLHIGKSAINTKKLLLPSLKSNLLKSNKFNFILHQQICQLFGKGMKQCETTVLLGFLTMISFCLGHTSTSINDFWSEPIILWTAIVLPTGKNWVYLFKYTGRLKICMTIK